MTAEILEQRLLAHLSKSAKQASSGQITLLEVIDESGIWPDPFDGLFSSFSDHSFDSAIERFPALLCAAATEIGFRYEGVGSVFWQAFEDALGTPIATASRPKLADAFSALAAKFSLVRPEDTAFNRQFSIISWPIINALMPFEMAPSVGRLLARGPVSQSSTSGTRSDLPALRIWASVWEGARLKDWLRNDSCASRVLNSLLCNSTIPRLNPITEHRLHDAFVRQSDAYFSLKTATRRRAASKPLNLSKDQGELTLNKPDGSFHLTVSWSPLSVNVYEAARAIASARNWRPKLWGEGPAIHAEKALGSLPIVLKLTAFPPEHDCPFTLLEETFQDSGVVSALAARTINWTSPFVFLRDEDDQTAGQLSPPLTKEAGAVWIMGKSLQMPGLPVEGELYGVQIYAADLSNDAHRAILKRHDLWSSNKPDTEVVRASLDAITLPKGRVRTNEPILLKTSKGLRIERISRVGRTPNSGLTITAVEPPAPVEVTPNIFIFERQAAFDALVESRLRIRVESAIGNASWTFEALLMSGSEIISFAKQTVRNDDGMLGADEPVLRALQADSVRARLLELGKAQLRVRVQGFPWEAVRVERIEGEVNWDVDDPAVQYGRSTEIAIALTNRPHHFIPPSAIVPQGDAPKIWALIFPDGRFALPAKIYSPKQFHLADLSSNFSDTNGGRQLFAAGAGVLELARSRTAWASADCGTLGDLSVRTRVTKQFERPLVSSLCGLAWVAKEDGLPPIQSPAKLLLNSVIETGLVGIPPEFEQGDLNALVADFSALLSAMQPECFTSGTLDSEATDHALNQAFEQVIEEGHRAGRLGQTDPADYDPGAPSDVWLDGLSTALSEIRMTSFLELIIPTAGAKSLAARTYSPSTVAEASMVLADWSQAWCLPRGQIDRDVALHALNFWLNPTTSDPDAVIRTLARDPFLTRGSRYIALRTIRSEYS